MPGVTLTAARTRTRRATDTTAAAQDHTHLAGCILWLPERKDPGYTIDDDDDDDDDDGNGTLEEGCYNHPVVVLSPQVRKGKVVILILTSFNDTDLADRHAHSLEARLAYLPIAPCRRHPDNGRLLRLADRSPPLRKNSYVHAAGAHTVAYARLEPYDRRVPRVLSAPSYRELVEYARCRVPLPGIIVGPGVGVGAAGGGAVVEVAAAGDGVVSSSSSSSSYSSFSPRAATWSDAGRGGCSYPSYAAAAADRRPPRRSMPSRVSGHSERAHYPPLTAGSGGQAAPSPPRATTRYYPDATTTTTTTGLHCVDPPRGATGYDRPDRQNSQAPGQREEDQPPTTTLFLDLCAAAYHKIVGWLGGWTATSSPSMAASRHGPQNV